MKFAYFDSDKNDVVYFRNIISNLPYIESCAAFTSIKRLFDYIKNHTVDILFTGISSENTSVSDYINKVKSICPLCSIIFVTTDTNYAYAALKSGATGFILKSDLKEKLMLLTEKKYTAKLQPEVHIKTFGNFDLFVNGKAVMFANKKSKEMLALLTDKCGGSLNMEQIIDVLWEDRPYNESTKVLYRIALKGLRDTLKKHNCYHILIESKRQRSLDITKVSCDYYDFLKNKLPSGMFGGEYMTNYSWGEYTLAKILNINYTATAT